MNDYLPAIIAAIVALSGTVAGFIAQRKASRSTEINAQIDQFQEQALAASERADKATERADKLQDRVDTLWTQMQDLRRDFAAQIMWRDTHILQLVKHINAGKGPPPPQRPEGLSTGTGA